MIVQRQVSVGTEIDMIMGLVVKLVSDIKAKKSINEDITDLVGPFFAALQSLGDLSVELKDRKVVESTVALKLSELVDVFLT